MIVIDKSETRETSNTPTIPKAKVVSWLEERTGADLVISGWNDVPITPATLGNHLEHGALMIQIKNGADMVSSIGTRLNESLARMLAVGPSRQWQRILLPVGYYARDPETDKVMVGSIKSPAPGKKHPFILWWLPEPPVHWRGYLSAIRRWNFRGGTVASGCKTPADLLAWIKDAESDLKVSLVDDYASVKDIWSETPKLYADPEPDDPLQRLRLIKDWRVVLCAVPGIGPKRVDALARALRENGSPDRVTGAAAFAWATMSPASWVSSFKVEGWGPKTRMNFREFMGLDVDELSLVEYFQAEALTAEALKVLSTKEWL